MKRIALCLTLALFVAQSLPRLVANDSRQSFLGMWLCPEAPAPRIMIKQDKQDAQLQVRLWRLLEEQDMVEEVPNDLLHCDLTRGGENIVMLRVMANMDSVAYWMEISAMDQHLQVRFLPQEQSGNPIRVYQYRRHMTASKHQQVGVIGDRGTVINQPTGSSGLIEGQATGKASIAASIFRIDLYGPNNKKQFFASRNFDHAHRFRFDGLPDGKYWLIVRPQSQSDLSASPDKVKIKVKDGSHHPIKIKIK